MAKLLGILLAILLAISLSESKSAFPTLLELNYKKSVLGTRDVFEPGTLRPELINVNVSEIGSNSPPTPLLIVRPTTAQNYSLVLFLHGNCLDVSFYTDLFEHIASHGYIIVAPQLYNCPEILDLRIPVPPISGRQEVDLSTEVANWIPSNINEVLKAHNTHVKADLNKLVISGHGRGGKTAFAMLLGRSNVKLATKFSAIVGVDPVEAEACGTEINPKILTNVPNSFNISVPVAVIGSGLNGQPSPWFHIFPCAPRGLNHAEFYYESRSKASHPVVTDYGHNDILNDDLPDSIRIIETLCEKTNESSKDPMRKTVGGITVAFLKYLFLKNNNEYMTILQNPDLAPARIKCSIPFKKAQYVDVANV